MCRKKEHTYRPFLSKVNKFHLSNCTWFGEWKPCQMNSFYTQNFPQIAIRPKTFLTPNVSQNGTYVSTFFEQNTQIPRLKLYLAWGVATLLDEQFLYFVNMKIFNKVISFRLHTKVFCAILNSLDNQTQYPIYVFQFASQTKKNLF